MVICIIGIDLALYAWATVKVTEGGVVSAKTRRSRPKPKRAPEGLGFRGGALDFGAIGIKSIQFRMRVSRKRHGGLQGFWPWQGV